MKDTGGSGGGGGGRPVVRSSHSRFAGGGTVAVGYRVRSTPGAVSGGVALFQAP